MCSGPHASHGWSSIPSLSPANGNSAWRRSSGITTLGTVVNVSLASWINSQARCGSIASEPDSGHWRKLWPGRLRVRGSKSTWRLRAGCGKLEGGTTPMSDANKMTLRSRLAVRFAFGVTIGIAVLFIPAGSLRFWEGWVFIAELMAASLFMSIYFYRHDRDLLQRRLETKEKEDTQRIFRK